jgi:hypothetical protein
MYTILISPILPSPPHVESHYITCPPFITHTQLTDDAEAVQEEVRVAARAAEIAAEKAAQEVAQEAAGPCSLLYYVLPCSTVLNCNLLYSIVIYCTQL